MAKYIDIETAPLQMEALKKQMPEFKAAANIKDPEKIKADIAKKRAKFIRDAALHPESGSVLAWGIYDDFNDRYIAHDVKQFDGSEHDLLSEFWDYLTPIDSVYGWNIHGFDLPFLVKRSWRQGVKVPHIAFSENNGKRFIGGAFVDLMRFYAFGSSDRFMSLDTALTFLGLDTKEDLGGKLPYEIWEEDRILFAEYLQRDVMACFEISKIIA